jgi:general secretion pathway protein A
MYEDFFGLSASPFELSPDPFFLFPSEKSKEALASITFAINRRKGFVVMTGEVGTGKTMMLRCLFELWEREQIPFAYFIGPRLSTVDFLTYITLELGITVAEPTKGNLLRALYSFLLAQFERGLTTVLIIDEAHQIPRRVLEEIRLLTNFETAQQKLVQILLVGQPELDAKLDSPELRSLKQRIAVRCRLEPLSEEEVRDYIFRRLEIAGAAPSQASAIFPAETIRAVSHYSMGIPRLVNNICDQALIAACTQQGRTVSVAMIEEIANHFRLHPATGWKQPETPLAHVEPAETSTPPPLARAAAAGIGLAGVKGPDTAATLREQEMNNAASAESSMLSEADISAVIQTGGHVGPRDANPAPEPIVEAEQSSNVEALVVEPPTLEAPPVASPIVEAVQLPAESPVVSDAAPVSNAAAPVTHASAAFPSLAPPADIHEKSAPAKSASPPINRTAAPAAPFNPRGEFSFGRVEAQSLFNLPGLIRTWLGPGLRLSVIIGAAAVVAVGLAAGVSIARRPKVPVAAARSQPVATSENTSEHETLASEQPVEADPATLAPDPLGADSIKLPTDSAITKSSDSAVVKHVAPRPKVAASKLPRPVVKSPRLTASNEPPAIPGAPASNILDLGRGLADISPPVSAPRAASPGGRLEEPRLLSSPPPAYPPRARAANVQGSVVIDTVVDEKGNVGDMKVVSGSGLLTQAAMDAVRTWKYQPARLNGDVIATHVQVRVNFSLQ